MRLLKLPPPTPIVHLRWMKRTVSYEKLHYKLILLYFGWSKKKKRAIKGMFGALPWCAFHYAHPPACLFHFNWAEIIIHFIALCSRNLQPKPIYNCSLFYTNNNTDDVKTVMKITKTETPLNKCMWQIKAVINICITHGVRLNRGI